MRLYVVHEVNVMLDTGILSKVAVTHFVVRLEYLQYYVPSVFESSFDLYCFVSLLRIVDHFLLRLCEVRLHAGIVSLAEAEIIALDCEDCAVG